MIVGLWSFFTLALGASTWAYAQKQNQRAAVMGGRIASPKAFWLVFAVLNWFFLPLVLVVSGFGPHAFRQVLFAFLLLMWPRGLIELLMLYGAKHWRPLYGIIHDLVCAGVLVVGCWLMFTAESFRAAGMGDQAFSFAYLTFLFLTLSVECFYAASFSQLVGNATSGTDAIWFASEDDPKFQKVVRTTKIWNQFLGAVWLMLSLYLVWSTAYA